ncbi:MAG: tetratricopeptide repeat protein [Caldimicrobium sp.]|jgi:Flp pilus assembly protein TadD|nr:tetratricopeptide repeat protein [Caldimicrobium sp.]
MKLPHEELLLPLVEDWLPKKGEKGCPRCYLLDHLFDNFYTEEIFECLVEAQKPLRGYFFKYQDDLLPKDFTFIRLKNLFFYPLFFGNSQELFLSLWKEDVSFTSFYAEVSRLPNPSEVENHLQVISSLGFSRLTKRAEERLAPILKLEKVWLSLKEKEEISKLLFIVSSFPFDEELKEGIILKEEGKEHYYVLRDAQGCSLKEENLTQGAILGFVPGEKLKEEPFSRFSPFLLALSAFEHAKRAGLMLKEVEGFSLHVLADIIYELEDLGFAKRVYEIAKDYTLQPIELTLSLASIYYTLSDLDTAEKLLRGKLCGCIREDPMVHHNLGLVYLAKGNLSYAEYHLYKAYLLDPENRAIRQRLIQFLFDQGRISDILEILAGKEDLSPQEALILGKIYFRQGDYDRALSLLSQLLASPERDGEASLYLAWLYLNLRKNEEVANLFLDEARSKLSTDEFERLKRELNL